MCGPSEFIHNFCLDQLDSVTGSYGEGGKIFILGMAIEILIFALAFHLLHEVNRNFTKPAIESMYIRRGGSSEAVVSILHCTAMSLPEILIAGGTMFRIGGNIGGALSLKSSIGGGLLAFLGIPAILVSRVSLSLPAATSLRDQVSYVGCLVLLLFIVLDSSVPVLGSVLLLMYFGVYTFVISRTYKYEQRQRDIRRETRLLEYLTPIQQQLADVELAELSEISPLEVHDPLIVGPHMTPSFTARGLSYICVKAEPGTQSEQIYVWSILNAIAVELFLAYLVACVIERWLGFFSTISFPVDLLGWMVIPLLTQSYNLYLATTLYESVAISTFLSSVWQSHCISSSLGLGLPWLMWTMSRSSIKLDRSNSFCLTLFIAAGFLALAFIYAVGNRSQHQIALNEGSRFYYVAFLAVVALLGFIHSVRIFI